MARHRRPTTRHACRHALPRSRRESLRPDRSLSKRCDLVQRRNSQCASDSLLRVTTRRAANQAPAADQCPVRRCDDNPLDSIRGRPRRFNRRRSAALEGWGRAFGESSRARLVLYGDRGGNIVQIAWSRGRYGRIRGSGCCHGLQPRLFAAAVRARSGPRAGWRVRGAGRW